MHDYRRPRFDVLHAMRGGYVSATPTNLATFTLYNNGKLGELLAVWVFVCTDNAGNPVNLGVYKGQIGSVVGAPAPLVTEQQPAIGEMCFADTATVYAADTPSGAAESTFGVGIARWPIAVLTPGWSLFAQDTVAANALYCAVWWTEITMEDLKPL